MATTLHEPVNDYAMQAWYDRGMDYELLHRFMHRPKDANKYDFGHVLIFGGSSGMVGAPLLAGRAALRIGAGLVTIASDQATTRSLDKRVEEIMTLTLPDYSDPHAVVKTLADFVVARKVSVLIMGPGLPVEAAATVRLLTAKLKLPIVLDAGGLAAFETHAAELREATRHNKAVVITPHSGEYKKLVGQSNVKPTQFAKDYNVTVVLKGNHTQVAFSNGVTWQNSSGNPGMATAGTGDVLSGVIAGLLSQDIELKQAVELGVYIHGFAGDMAARAKSEPGMIASDIIEFLPATLKELKKYAG